MFYIVNRDPHADIVKKRKGHHFTQGNSPKVEKGTGNATTILYGKV